MKKQFIIALGLMVSMSTIAQKKELRTLEKAVKNNNYAEAKAAVSQLEPMLGSMDDKLKSKYYFNKAQAYYANGAGTNADFKMAISDLAKVDEKHVSEVAVIKQGLQNELLTKANTLYTTGKYSDAAKLFEMLYILVPEDEVYLYYAAASAVSAQELEVALNHYLKLRELGYTGIETQYLATNKETGEEEAFDKVTRDLYVSKLKTHIKPREAKTESKTAEITKNIALIYNSLGESEKGLEAIKVARQADPTSVELILTEANMQYKLGNKEAYTKLIKEAIKNDPNNKDLLYNLGVLASESGNIEDAKKYYNRVLELDPAYINASTNIAALILSEEVSVIEEMNSLGSSAADNKRYDELKQKRVEIYSEAIPYLEGVLKIDDDNIDVAKTKDVLGDAQTVNYVPFRNTILLSICCSYAESIEADTVYHGAALVDSQAGYWDGSQEFLDNYNNLIALNRRTKISVEAPLIKMSKKEIIELGVQREVDFSKTHTCYSGEEIADAENPASSSRIQGFIEAGFIDPVQYRQSIPWKDYNCVAIS